ncbi:MAG: penicillin-insensitive murein endopeptidase [Sandaracinaceae bacterium]
MLRARNVAFLATALISVAAWPVGADMGDAPTTDAATVHSRGWVYRGRLDGGVALTDSPLIHQVESFVEAGRHYGTPGLVGLLHRVSNTVAQAHGDARLNVGELSQAGGGDVVGHRSHESGRDVDIGFYLQDDDGASVEPSRFVRIHGAGRGWLGEGRRVTFDTERNWALVEALITDAETPVQLIFVAAPLRRRLIRHARARRLPTALIERAEWVLLPPEGVAAHDDHFHVRVYCPAGDDTCEDRRPFWQWVPARFVPSDAERSPRYWPHSTAP